MRWTGSGGCAERLKLTSALAAQVQLMRETIETELGVLAGRISERQPLIGITEIENEAGFLPMDGLWWRRSGKAVFDAAHFFLPVRQLDPYGHAYEMSYDAHHLAMTETSTSVYGKTVKTKALLDYRTGQPTRLIPTVIKNQTQTVTTKCTPCGTSKGKSTPKSNESGASNPIKALLEPKCCPVNPGWANTYS